MFAGPLPTAERGAEGLGADIASTPVVAGNQRAQEGDALPISQNESARVDASVSPATVLRASVSV